MSKNTLVIEKILPATPDKVFRAWTEEALLKQWFCPKPWGLASAEIDLRAGGNFYSTMLSPEGKEFPNRGIFLEVVPNRRLVFTDAYVKAWVPSEKPFMTVEVTLEPVEGGTLYRAEARHWTAEDREAHEKMGFQEGWGKCAEQLAELVKTL